VPPGTRAVTGFEPIGLACRDLAASRLVWDALAGNDG
jgi:hypothetical protein